jgi:HlyD family secretion protein
MKCGHKIYFVILLTLTLSIISGCRKANVIELNGTVESNEIYIVSEVNGRIKNMLKEEGEHVKKGEVIAYVDSALQESVVNQNIAIVSAKKAKVDELISGSRPELINQAKANVEAMRAKYEDVKSGNRLEQIKQGENAVKSAGASLNLAKQNLDYLTEQYEKARDDYEKIQITKVEFDAVKNKYDTSNSAFLNANENYKSALSQLNLLKEGATKNSIEVARANYDQAVAQFELVKNGTTQKTIEMAQAELINAEEILKQSKISLERFSIKSPIEGIFLLKSVEVGDVVSSGRSVGKVSDLKNLWIAFFIPQKYLGNIFINQEINLITSGMKNEIIKGKITYISSKGEFTPKNTETIEVKENTVFKIKVKITSQLEKVKPGMVMTVAIPVVG